MATYTVSGEVAPVVELEESSGKVRLVFARQAEIGPVDEQAETSTVPVITLKALNPEIEHEVAGEIATLGDIVLNTWENDIVKQFVAGAVSTSRTTLYTVPTLKSAVVRWVDLVNTTGSSITVDIWLGGVLWASDWSVPANDSVSRDTIQVLGAGAIIEMQASGAGINAFVSGVLEVAEA